MIYRIDIEKALDEMISDENGMGFQGLAVVLAKLKYPELIASERHNDLGLDSYVPAHLASDGLGKGLACSLTATSGKLKSDIERFQQHVNDVSILLFATPKKVTRAAEEAWKSEIKNKYGIELIIIPREDIITDLMKPANVSLCQSHFNIHVSVEPTIQELVTKAREVTSEILTAWLAHTRLDKRPKIELQPINLDKDGHQIGEVLTLTGLSQLLQEGRRIVLEAPAGQGKTTTLIQLAERMDQLSFLIDLPTWVKSDDDILEFISKMPQFRSCGIDATALAQIYRAMPCSFLLNGWNEVPDNYSDRAVRALADLERNFPKAGIIVATRAHHVKPPLPGCSRVQLLSLNSQLRKEYLNRALISRAREFSSQLENNSVLDSLTRTPLILAEAVNIFLLGEVIPKTKTGILDAMMRLIESSDEHGDHLARSPLLGKSQDYLADLATQMTKRGAVTMEEAHARSIVTSVSRKLQDDGQITTLPEPSEVLSALCAHHVLERLEYPSVAFRFQHQQFQEWYVATVLRGLLLGLIEKNDPDSDQDFIREYINKPFWEESLRMVAEEVGDLKVESLDAKKLVKVGKMLVESTLEVDPVFAADIARLCGSSVWTEVRNDVGDCLRSWYQSDDDSHKNCALAGMITSGSEDFKDVILPLLTSDDQQVRLRTYRSSGEFHVSTLGENWKQIVKTWKDEHQADFVGEITREPYMANVAEEFAGVDSSPKVRVSALGALDWIGATEALNRILTSYNDDTFKEVLRKRMLHDIPQEMRGRTITVYNLLLQETSDQKDRLRILLDMAGIGGEQLIENIKTELTGWPSEKISDGEEPLIKLAIELVQKDDPDWVSLWIATRIIEGLLWSDRWLTFISSLPQADKQDLLKKIGEETLDYRDSSAIASVLTATADQGLAGDVFSRLCSLQIEQPNSSREALKTQWEIIRQLQGLFRALPPDIAISGMLERLSPQFNSMEHQVVIELFGKIGDTGSDLRDQLPDAVRQALRTYLKEGIAFVLGEDDFNGSLKSDLATALARIGDPEDTSDLDQLIQSDIERVRKGREALRKGDHGPIGNGASMSWSNWHVRAIECLDPQGAEGIILKVLNEPEYEGEAAKALIRLARINNSVKGRGFGRKNYQVVWEARSGQQENNFDADRRRRYVDAIKQRISVLKEQQSQSDKPDFFIGRLKMYACVLAVFDSSESTDLIMEIMALPGQWDSYTRVEALEALLFNGAIIKADAALKVLDPVIDHITQPSQFHDQQNRFLLQRCFCLLPFIDPPSVGIKRIKEIITTTRMPVYDLREILFALGNSRCDEALDLLLELPAKYGSGLNHIRSEWIESIMALNTPKAKKVLLSFIDPEIEPFKGQMNFEYHVKESLIEHIANIARSDSDIRSRVYELCKTKCSPSARSLLSGVVSHIGTSEALVAGLNLVYDQLKPSIPYEFSRGLESVFLGRRPYEGGYYTIEPITANEIRRCLFEMALGDESRKRSAWHLLGQIEVWRLEYGRPNNEPRHPDFDSGKPWPFFGEIDVNAKRSELINATFPNNSVKENAK